MNKTWMLRAGAVAAAAMMTATVIPTAHAVEGTVPTGAAAAATVKIEIAGNPDAAPGELRERACSGVLVHASWVLTSASCLAKNPGDTVVTGAPAWPTTAIVGRPDLTGTTGKVVTIDRLVPHSSRDVVMAHLSSAVSGVTPVAVASTAPQVDDVLTLAGYGRTATTLVPDTAHAAQYRVASVGSSTLDVVGADEDAAVCKGDSGGPALRATSGGGIELVAIHHTSYQGGCLGATSERTEATETRVDDIRTWISTTHTPPTPTPTPTRTPTPTPTPTRVKGTDSVGVVRGTIWYQNFQSDGSASERSLAYGTTGDIPVVGDWNGDGVDTIGIVRGNVWHLTDNPNGGSATRKFAFGDPGDIPVVGDWNGDGIDTVGVVRGDEWHLNNQNDASAAEYRFRFGNPGDTPVVGDWNGDGRDTVGVVQGTVWNLNNQNDASAVEYRFIYGELGDTPVVGDWNGDGKDSPGIVRRYQWHLSNTVGASRASSPFSYGQGGDRVIVGDWDGR